jgi:O-antigen/teichoic acid export membrane protein
VLHSAGLSARLNGLVHALDRAIAVLLVPVLLPGLFLAEPFLRLWLGSYGTPELALAFRILLIAFVLPAFAMPISSVLVASGNSRLPARFAWLTVVVALGSMLWLVPRHGLAGAALGMLLGNATSLWFSWQARRALAVPPAADRMPFWGGLLLGCTAQALLLVVVAAAALSWGRLLLAAASAWALFYVVRAIFKRLAPEELQLLSRARSAARR